MARKNNTAENTAENTNSTAGERKSFTKVEVQGWVRFIEKRHRPQSGEAYAVAALSVCAQQGRYDRYKLRVMGANVEKLLTTPEGSRVNAKGFLALRDWEYNGKTGTSVQIVCADFDIIEEGGN